MFVINRPYNKNSGIVFRRFFGGADKRSGSGSRDSSGSKRSSSGSRGSSSQGSKGSSSQSDSSGNIDNPHDVKTQKELTDIYNKKVVKIEKVKRQMGLGEKILHSGVR